MTRVHYTTMEAIMDADDRERERRSTRDKQFDAMVELLRRIHEEWNTHYTDANEDTGASEHLWLSVSDCSGCDIQTLLAEIDDE